MKLSLFLLLIIISITKTHANDKQIGFYRVNPKNSCQVRFGKILFLNNENFPDSSNCQFTFINNDVRTVGLSTRFFAHRGDARYYPANTIDAFNAALEQGYKGFELDLWPSKDNVLMVSHDNKLHAATTCRGKI